MRRRDLILAALSTAAWPLTAHAQHAGRVFRIAILVRAGMGTGLADLAASRHWRAWNEELQRLGYVEGKNLIVERRSVGSNMQQAQEIVADIVRFKPAAVFTPAQNLANALVTATTTIPIVAIAADPVGSGLAASLARPGRNVTGFSIDAGLDIVEKRFSLLKEIIPAPLRVAYLTPRIWWDGRFGDNAREAARRAGVTIIGIPWDPPASEMEFRRVFAAALRQQPNAFYAIPALEHLAYRELLAELAGSARLPGIYGFRENVEAGGLMAYSADLADIFRRAAGYIDSILKGAAPADMPFQQPTRFEFVVNLKTANALGLALPQLLLARADEVIE